MLMTFVQFFFFHLLFDFPFQPDKWVQDKEAKKHRSKYLYIHTLLHGIGAWCVGVRVLGFGGITKALCIAVIIAFSHGLIDWLKLMFQNDKNKPLLFFIDQLLHIAVLAAAALYMHGMPEVTEEAVNKAIIVACSLLFLYNPSSLLVLMLMKVFKIEVRDEQLKPVAGLEAGKYIGILERMFVLGFILSNHWEGIGFLLGAKSVFRFGDLRGEKDRELTEYFLVGTLLSFALASITGMAALKLIEWFT